MSEVPLHGLTAVCPWACLDECGSDYPLTPNTFELILTLGTFFSPRRACPEPVPHSVEPGNASVYCRTRPRIVADFRWGRSTSITRNCTALGPIRSLCPGFLGDRQGGGRFLMSQVPLYTLEQWLQRAPSPQTGRDQPSPASFLSLALFAGIWARRAHRELT